MKTLLWCCCWALMFASAMRPSLATPTTTTNSSSAEQHRSALHDAGTAQNSTAIATSSPVDDGDNGSRASDSGELTGGDRGEDDGGGGGGVVSADGTTAADRVSELYEDLEDSVVFEDADGHGRDGGASVDDAAADHQLPLTDVGPVPANAGESSASAEEYEAAAGDSSPAGTSPVGHVLQRSVKYPEYVRSSSYRRGWPGGNVTRPEELFRFWDPYELTATPAVSSLCAEHVQLYQAALRNGKMWAFKSEFVVN